MKILAHYNEFESCFIKRNNILLKLLVLCFLVSSLLLTLTLLKNEYFYFSEGNTLKTEMLKESFCLESFENVTSTSPSTTFLKEGILKLVVSEPFLIKDMEVLYLNDFKTNSCKIIISSFKGLRSFIVILDQSVLYPFNYKLKELVEVEVEKGALN